MRIILTVPILILGAIILGLSLNAVSAELIANNAFILEGSGFAVTQESIKNSDIDFVISTGNKVGSRTSILVEDGFVTLNEDDFIVTDLSGTALRDGRFIRIAGTAEDSFGEEVSLRIFGRLIQNSEEGSIYGFTGRLTHEGETHKIIYTTKLSGLTSISIIQESLIEEENGEIVVRILPGSHNIAIVSSYIEATTQGADLTRAGYFFPDRISIEPGSSITFVNDDSVSHRVVSGTGLGTFNRVSQGALVICETPPEDLPEGFSFAGTECSFSFDGRIDSGEIQAGESWTGSFDDAGFYRIIDPNYPWMNLVVYSFPNVESLIIGTPGEAFN